MNTAGVWRNDLETARSPDYGVSMSEYDPAFLAAAKSTFERHSGILQALADAYRPHEIVKTSDLCSGHAHIRDTEITVFGLECWRRLGWTNDRILDGLPQLTRADLAAAWEYVSRNQHEIQRAIDEND